MKIIVKIVNPIGKIRKEPIISSPIITTLSISESTYTATKLTNGWYYLDLYEGWVASIDISIVEIVEPYDPNDPNDNYLVETNPFENMTDKQILQLMKNNYELIRKQLDRVQENIEALNNSTQGTESLVRNIQDAMKQADEAKAQLAEVQKKAQDAIDNIDEVVEDVNSSIATVNDTYREIIAIKEKIDTDFADIDKQIKDLNAKLLAGDYITKSEMTPITNEDIDQILARVREKNTTKAEG